MTKMARNYKIGLVMKSLQADFFQVMKEGAIRYAETLPCLELICVGTASQTEVEEQIQLMHSLVDQQVDAIVLVPIDSNALVESTVQAIRRGIPVINIDIRLNSQLLKQAGVEVPFVGPDNFTAAYEVGRRLCALLQSNDDVAIIEGLAAANNARERKDGFQKAIKEFGLHLVASESGNWETAEAAEAFQYIWHQYPDLKGVFCSNDAMALGIFQVMERSNKYIPIVGFDNDAVMKQYLFAGKLIATVDIFSSQMAVRGIEFALEVLRGKVQNEGVHLTQYAIIEKS